MASSKADAKFHLPGYNLPLDFTPTPGSVRFHYGPDGKRRKEEIPACGSGRKLFPTALAFDENSRHRPEATTLREFTMLHIMNSITDKPNWESKVFDKEITAKWTREAMETPGADVSENMMTWVIEELKFKTKIFQNTGAVAVYNADVVKSDCAVPETLRDALRTAAARLEDVLDNEKDYHPNSNEQVLDLVHPSLFPVIYGKTRIAKDRLLTIDDGINSTGIGEVLPGPETRRAGYNDEYSTKFQWLPCDVTLQASESAACSTLRGLTKANRHKFKCRIDSYINNLHPKDHGDLYKVVERIVECAVPLWNMSLTPLRASEPEKRIDYTAVQHYIPQGLNPPVKQEGEGDWDHEIRTMEWEQSVERLVQPEPESFTPRAVYNSDLFQDDEDSGEMLVPEETVDLYRDYAQTGLQIIVKLANIELTPEKPTYAGGTWHVEGQSNEHICATALYYYDSENITESRLAFQQECSDEDLEVTYGQGDHSWLPAIYGRENNEPLTQRVGDVVCKEGRLLTFPNVLQHRVQPFKLEDPTKPGHRKILALFLVDPNIRVISSAHVPAQQKDWWERTIPQEGAFGRLPQELRDNVVSAVDGFPISIEEAKELRLELMEERKAYTTNRDKMVSENVFSLCEH